MKNNQQWINESGTFFPVSGDTRLLESPGDGVFVVVQTSTAMMKRIGLKRIGDQFDFDFKIYELGLEPIIRLVKKTWFSDAFIEGNNKILIHCMGGCSRSPSIVIAYIMWKYQLSFNESFK